MKYRIPVHTSTYATKHAGYIECDTYEEYQQQYIDREDEFYNEGHMSTNISNDFEIGDVEVGEMFTEADIQYYKDGQ